MGRRAWAFGLQQLDQMAQDRLCGFGVGSEIAKHKFHTDVVMVAVPAVVIRHHAQGGVSDLGFPGQPGFREVGHADDRAAPASMQCAFSSGGKGGPLHAQIGSAPVDVTARR